MAYEITCNGRSHIIHEIGDFNGSPSIELIDLGTEDGMERYKELFTQKRGKKKKQISSQQLSTRQTTLDEFISFNSSNQYSDIEVLTPVVETRISPGEGRVRGALLLPKRDLLTKHIKKLKIEKQTFGRTRIKKELPEDLNYSEATISRILREQQLQNPPKRLVSEVKIEIRCPSLANYTGECFSLECGTKNGMILIILLFQQILEPLLKPFLTDNEIKHVLAYSLGMLFKKPVYQCLEGIPPKIMELLGFDKTIKLKNIAEILKTLGSYKEPIALEKIKAGNPKKVALDEKVIERYSKKVHIDTHDETCQMGYVYCSRRNKGVLAESIEVIADISQEGIALPLYFTFTPHSLTKKEQAKLAELGQKTAQQIEPISAPPGIKNEPSLFSHAPIKRIDIVSSLLDIISNNIGQVPLRFDNNYAQKDSIKRLQREGWSFIGHGRSNLKIVDGLKTRMKKEKSSYDCEIVESPDHGGPICIVGYQKNDRIHIYLTNETNYNSAKEIIEDYRARWRLENVFKWVSCLTLLSGSDPIVHLGQLTIALYFMAYLIHYFGAAISTIASLLELRASVYYEDSVLTVIFPEIRKHYWEKLAHLQVKLLESQFSRMEIIHDDK